MFANIINYLVASYRVAKLSEELSAMTEPELADIGISRSDIPRVVHDSLDAMMETAKGAPKREPRLAGPLKPARL